MKTLIIVNLFLLTFIPPCFSQQSEIIKRKGFEILFINQNPVLNPDTKKGLIDTFFKIYPALVRDFNKDAIKKVKVEIDTSYTGVAYANNGKITISAQWLEKEPLDFDMIIHEAMHIVQSYPKRSGPEWLIEGIADYVRSKYGITNKETGWSLPEYNEKAHYTNSYRVTARFLIWVCKNYNKNLVLYLDENLQNNTYTPMLWQKYTSFTIEELWKKYAKNPRL